MEGTRERKRVGRKPFKEQTANPRLDPQAYVALAEYALAFDPVAKIVVRDGGKNLWFHLLLSCSPSLRRFLSGGSQTPYMEPRARAYMRDLFFSFEDLMKGPGNAYRVRHSGCKATVECPTLAGRVSHFGRSSVPLWVAKRRSSVPLWPVECPSSQAGAVEILKPRFVAS